MSTVTLDNKAIVRDLLGRLPDAASLAEIAQEIQFVAAVRQGLSELDGGESVPLEQLAQELPSWLIP